MDWDETTVGITYVGSTPLDTEASPTVHNKVSISRNNFSFEVEIKSIDRSKYTGIVLSIDPIVEKNPLGIEAGQEVDFYHKNIKSLYR